MNVIDWLLDSDPAIRWQVMRDLTDAPAEDVAAERAKVAREGWGAAVLAAQRADGSWAGGAYAPEWTSTTSSLQLLRAFGVDPTEESVRRALALVRANVKWEYDDLPYFDGEVEPCINGQAVAIGAYFGQDVRVIVDRLLTEQMADGGWNCEQEPERGGSTRGSFDTTINVLEGLLEYERATWRKRGRRRCPRARAGVPARAPAPAPAVRWRDRRSQVASLRVSDRVALQRPARARPPPGCRRRAGRASHRGDRARRVEARRRRSMAARPRPARRAARRPRRARGEPSRWITLRALRVLRWAGRSQPALSSSAASA